MTQRRPPQSYEIGPAAARPSPLDRRVFDGYRYVEEETGIVNTLHDSEWIRGGVLAVSPDGATIRHITIDNTGAVEAVAL